MILRAIEAWVSRRNKSKILKVLTYLRDAGPSYGLDMCKAGVHERGTIYILLREMEESGLITSRNVPEYDLKMREAGVPSRAIFMITNEGRTWLDSHG